MVPAGADPVRVFADDDHPAFLATVELVVGAAPGFELIGTATSTASALEVLTSAGQSEGSAPTPDPASDPAFDPDLILDPGPDLILVDVVMPDGNGFDFVRRYRSGGGQAAIILMSSYEPADLLTELAESGPGQPAFLAKNELLPDLLATMWDRVAPNESPSSR